MSQIDDLPPLREVVRAHDLVPKKSLGQNFLFDLNLTSRVARAAGSSPATGASRVADASRAAGPLAGTIVVEVGPGPGGLTRALLAAGADEVIAIERDRRCLPALEQIARHYPGRLKVVEADALAFDPWPLLAGRPARIVANLPYNVGTALLTAWITTEPWPPWWQSLTLMFQREVAERIVADERNPRDYGRLGVLCGWRTRARILFDVPPSAFVPPPKVTSSVVQIEPRTEPLPCRIETLEAVTRAAFGQRRKMLRQSLKCLAADPSEIIRAAGLEETARPETVPVAGFIALANAVDRSRKSS